MRILSLLMFAFAASQAGATITISSISGASGFTAAASGSTAIMFGGTSGPECGTSGNQNTSTCNSCDSTTVAQTCGSAAEKLCTCNTTRIYDAGVVRVTVKRTDTPLTGKTRLVKSDNTTTTALDTPSASSESVDVTWEKLCLAAGATTNCIGMPNANVTLKAFTDKNDDSIFQSGTEEAVDFQVKFVGAADNTQDLYGISGSGSTDGIGAFTPYPGDEKVYIEDLDTTGSFPTVSGSKIKNVRVYHSDVGMESNTPEASSVDLPVSSDGSELDRASVTSGLDNDKTYVFRIALVDEANNVMQFFPPRSSDSPGGDPTCDSTNPGFSGCPYAATPEKVLGLLTDDFNCFVATAAYGTAMEPKLNTFREFRWKILLQHKWGRKFVNWYYKYGSMAARYISDKPAIRAGTRVVLYPAFWFAKGSLKFGFFKTLAFSLLLLSSCVFIIWLGSRRIFGAP